MSIWLFYFLLSFILGITLRSFWEIPWLFFINLALIFFASLILRYLNHKKSLKIIWLFTFASIFIALGIIRLDSAFSYKDELKSFRDSEEIISLTGIIKKEPELRDNHIKYTILTKPFNEKILISAPLSSDFSPGDKISLEGTIQTPTEFPEFNYKDYLLKDGVQTVSYYPEIELIEKKRWNFFGLVLKIKNRLRESVRKVFPFPQSELLAAMVLGDKQLLPDNLKESFNKTGIRHITAISGMHITIIASFLMTFFTYGSRLGKDKAFYLVLALLIFYITLVGFPSSAIRAGIMASIVLLAEKVRRGYFATRALVLAAAVMLSLNPLLLRLDIGFQLSFLAVLGIIYISPYFDLIFDKFIKNSKLNWLKKVIAMTLGAQISTLPVLIYNFGLFSGSAPIVNVLVVPIIPFIIGLGFVGIFAGVISQTLGILISFPAYLLLSYVIWISDIFENLKISGMKIENFHYSLIILFYITLIAVILFLKRKFPESKSDLMLGSTNKKSVL